MICSRSLSSLRDLGGAFSGSGLSRLMPRRYHLLSFAHGTPLPGGDVSTPFAGQLSDTAVCLPPPDSGKPSPPRPGRAGRRFAERARGGRMVMSNEEGRRRVVIEGVEPEIDCG